MAIQVRRGLRKDFDPAKMLPGEWAVAIDSDTHNQIVWMCFAAGVVKRMGTYEDFMAQIQDISGDIINQFIAQMTEAQTQLQNKTETYIQGRVDDDWVPELQALVAAAQTSEKNAADSAKAAATSKNDAAASEDAAEKSATAAKESENAAAASQAASARSAGAAAESEKNSAASEENAENWAKQAESFAHGETGVRAGEETDNAREYARQAKESADKAERIASGDTAENTVTFESGDTEDPDAWEDVAVIGSGEKHKTLLGKLSTMARNVRYIWKILGSTDISKVQDGTVTGIIAALKDLAFSGAYADISGTPSSLPARGGDADTVGGKSPSDLQDYNNLSNKPAIPAAANNAKLIINQNGTKKGEFTANQAGNDVVVNLTDTNTDTNTTYSAGNGLTLTGTTFAAKILNALTGTDQSYALSAPMGKSLQDRISELNTKIVIESTNLSIGVNEDFGYINAKSGYHLASVIPEQFTGPPDMVIGINWTGYNYAIFTKTATSSLRSLPVWLTWIKN